jgi:hypothetical protein
VTDIPFEAVWPFGMVLLGIVLFVFATRQRQLTRREREASDKVARENWGKEEIH